MGHISYCYNFHIVPHHVVDPPQEVFVLGHSGAWEGPEDQSTEVVVETKEFGQKIFVRIELRVSACNAKHKLSGGSHDKCHGASATQPGEDGRCTTGVCWMAMLLQERCAQIRLARLNAVIGLGN